MVELPAIRFSESLLGSHHLQVGGLSDAVAPGDQPSITQHRLFRLFLSDVRRLNASPVEEFVVGEARTAFEEYILSDEKKDVAYMREQLNAVHFIQERYSWFLTEAFQQTVFEKKKSQRKLPLAQRIYENCLDAFVSGVSLGKSPEVDAPQVNIQYAVLEINETHHKMP